MQRLSRHRGAISVFLLLIFMVSYVFIGLLVDAGRYRLAQVYAESALDNATTSILSNYNRMVYELYGLFAVDTGAKSEEELNAEIKKLYNRYLDETMGILDVDTEKYKTELNKIFENDVNTLSTSGMYDFQYEIECGTTITLADMENVESQIIEYMKFRAPVELVADMKGFLKKMSAILEMKERVQEAHAKAELTKKYEGGSNPLSGEAQALMKDLNTFARKLYQYTVTPELSYAGLGIIVNSTTDLDTLFKQAPKKMREYVTDFDKTVDNATTKWKNTTTTLKDNYKKDLGLIRLDLEKYLKETKQDITLSHAYNRAGEPGENMFLKVDRSLFNGDEHFGTIKELYADLYDNIKDREEEEFVTFCEKYVKILNTYDKGIINRDNTYKNTLDNAYTTLTNAYKNAEATARSLHAEANGLRDRIQNTVGRYETYIKEMETERNKKGSSENLKTIYDPEIELAQENAGELVKNLDIILNSRQYLFDIGNGFPDSSGGKKELISTWMEMGASKIRDLLETNFLESNKKKESDGKSRYDKMTEDEKAMAQNGTPLAKYLGNYDEKYKTKEQAKDLYKTPYSATSHAVAVPAGDMASHAVSELMPELQGDISSLNSLAGYYYDSYYRKDVDVNTDVKDTEINSEDNDLKDKSKVEQNKDNPVDTAAIIKNPSYLKINYQQTAAVSPDDVDNECEINGKVDLDFLTKILSLGNSLIESLGKMLEGARDNLYVDAYVMTMFPNYRDNYKVLEEGNKLLADPYKKYQASWAEVEYIITGAGAGSNKLLGNMPEITKASVFNVPDKEDVSGEKGFGMLSVEAMRTKLLGTRLLFNLLAIFTDTAKCSQAASLSSWAGPFAPLVAVVLLVAWATAESAVDVAVLMGNGSSIGLDGEDGVYLFKQGADWYFSLGGIAKNIAELAVDTLADEIFKKASDVTDSLEKKVNAKIYEVYVKAKDAADSSIDELKGEFTGVVQEYGAELKSNINNITEKDVKEISHLTGQTDAGNLADSLINNASSTTGQAFDSVKNTVDSTLDTAQEKAAVLVSRAGNEIKSAAKKTIENAGQSAKDFIGKNISKVIPAGKVVNTGDSDSIGKVKMTYKDYLYFYLFTMNRELKIKRIMAVIQANMHVGGQTNFSMENSPVVVWADMEATMKYMFLSEPIVPENIKRKGRLRFKVISAQSY